MSALKDLYSRPFYNKLCDTFTETIPGFNKQEFIKQIYSGNWEEKELKDRMKHTTAVLHRFMPKEYKKAAKLIKASITHLRKRQIAGGLEFIFFPDYIETYGIDDFEEAVQSIEFVTQFISCEFAVRPFILKYGERMMNQMLAWSRHKEHSVRRLASEGSRPRLPWAMAIPALKKDPSATLPILENLKNDPSEWVRKSVANHINDIAKDNPHIVIGIAHQWRSNNKETNAIIKHGSRTLLKQGHPEILHYYGLDTDGIQVSKFKVLTPVVKTGDSLAFSFTLENKSSQAKHIRIEYAIYYRRQNNTLSKKVFKISEKDCQPGESLQIIRQQSFRLITTRVFYPGKQQVSVIINGIEQAVKSFELQ